MCRYLGTSPFKHGSSAQRTLHLLQRNDLKLPSTQKKDFNLLEKWRMFGLIKLLNLRKKVSKSINFKKIWPVILSSVNTLAVKTTNTLLSTAVLL